MKSLLLDTVATATLAQTLVAAPAVQNAIISLAAAALVRLGQHLFHKRRVRRAARVSNGG